MAAVDPSPAQPSHSQANATTDPRPLHLPEEKDRVRGSASQQHQPPLSMHKHGVLQGTPQPQLRRTPQFSCEPVKRPSLLGAHGSRSSIDTHTRRSRPRSRLGTTSPVCTAAATAAAASDAVQYQAATDPGWMYIYIFFCLDTRLGVATTLGSAVAAMCVQLVDASGNLAIHMTTRILLRSSSTHEPSDPPLEVVFLASLDAPLGTPPLRRFRVTGFERMD